MAAVMMFALLGCDRQQAAPPTPEKPQATSEKPAAPEPKVEAPEPEPGPAEPKSAEGDTALDPTAELKALSLLVAADKLDGKEDQIIVRCASCSLGMDGKKEHSLEFMDYTFYFCTADCRKHFGEDLVESVLALKIPGG